MNIYKQLGYENRKDYLTRLAEYHNIRVSLVFGAADVLGEDEDFDGLINVLKAYEELE